jgi:3-deoxy-manno-octulosonate cytidylyltransferase (CMP-KDO synthetase)
VLNLQGDAPFTPVSTIVKLLSAFEKNKKLEVVTPVHQLTWDELDRLRDSKKITPLSGTTAVIGENGRALWFSKSILPIMRDEGALRAAGGKSPVFQHIGLYGYRVDALEEFCALPQGRSEKLEGLEQLRFLENGIVINTVEVDETVTSGIDSPEDIQRAQEFMGAFAR